MKFTRYGAPYMGIKNDIAADIIKMMPKADHFYDLFAGGCAVTMAALLSGKYKHVHANDIGNTPQLFKNAINGKFNDRHLELVSREDFFDRKDDDDDGRPYHARTTNKKQMIWSI